MHHRGLAIMQHALDLEWKLFERQEKRVDGLRALSMGLIALTPTLMKLAFPANLSFPSLVLLFIGLIFWGWGLVMSLRADRTQSLRFQNTQGLVKITEYDEAWFSPNIERDRANALAKTAQSLSERRESLAKRQNGILWRLVAGGLMIASCGLVGMLGY